MKYDHNGFRSAWLILAGAVAFALPPLAAAQQQPVNPAPQAEPAADKPLDELEEVVVQGGRLYDRIVKAEDRFFKLYNELNKDDDYHVNCTSVALDDGSRIEQRFCMPAFFADAMVEQIRLADYCKSLEQTLKDDDGNDRTVPGMACAEPPPAQLVFVSRREEYVDNILKVVNSDPRLKEMAKEVEALHVEREQLSHHYDDIKAQHVSAAGKDHPRSTTRQ